MREHLKHLIILILTIVNLVEMSLSRKVCCDIDESKCPALVNGSIIKYPNYEKLRTPDLIKLYGYPVEAHEITTEDGYILTAYRIPYTNVSSERSGKVPVYLMHGVFASSAQWLWQPTNRALIFMLADAGYDVWIGNARGTSYSQKHRNLSIDDLNYWNFSNHEIGKFDTPAAIDYILNVTSQPSLNYIGHSLGVGQVFVALSLRPQYNSKIRTVFALAPGVYTGNNTNALARTVGTFYSNYFVFKALNVLNGGRYAPQAVGKLIKKGTSYCDISAVECGLCTNFYAASSGFNPCQTNFTMLPGLLAHQPDTASAKTFSHIAQGDVSGRFAQYDYGIAKNLEVYGTVQSPLYKFSNINVPVVIFNGKNDNLVTPKDVEKLRGALGSNVKESNELESECWNHVDFVVGKDADIYVYKPLINIMNNRTYG